MFKPYAIVLSGGTGTRMGSSVPKQFLNLKGVPVIMHSIKAFHQQNESTCIVVVLHKTQLQEWKELCLKHRFSIPHFVTIGGENRFQSVLQGLNFIWNLNEPEEQMLIAIHDGARPLVSHKMIEKGFREVIKKGAVVPVVKSKDSVRLLGNDGASSSLDREKVALVQTPQTFRSEVLRKAYRQNFDPGFTDDASVVEKSGHPIHLIEGDIRNIKITYPADLVMANRLFEID